MEKEKFLMEYFCDKRKINVGYTKCVSIGCGESVTISDDDLFPGREIGLDIDEFLIFYVRCPKCGAIHVIDNDLVPLSLQKKLVIQYAGIIEEYSQKVFLEQERSALVARIAEIDNQMNKLERMIENKKEKDSYKEVSDYQKRLYRNWKTVEELFYDK